MAITKILNIKETSGNPGRHLYNSVRYIMNPEKTGDGLLVGGNAGSEPWEVYSTMLDTKNAWGKTLGRQGYHFVISWKPGEADEQRAYAVAREFCEEYLGDSYDYVFAIHNDQGHMHGHIVFNSVNRDNGYKYRYESRTRCASGTGCQGSSTTPGNGRGNPTRSGRRRRAGNPYGKISSGRISTRHWPARRARRSSWNA